MGDLASGASQYLVGTPELFLELPEGPLHGTSVVIRAFCPCRLSAQLRPDQHPHPGLQNCELCEGVLPPPGASAGSLQHLILLEPEEIPKPSDAEPEA